METKDCLIATVFAGKRNWQYANAEERISGL